MLIPKFLFGTARDVRSSVQRIVTRLKRGESIQGVCESSEMIEFDTTSSGFIWLDNAWVLRPAKEADFRAVQLTTCLFDAQRIPFDRSNVIRKVSAEYLSSFPWGTVILNSGQGGSWLYDLPHRPLRPCRQAFVALLRGTMHHWHILTSFGPRFYRGGAAPCTFTEAIPAYGHAMAVLDVDPRGENLRWKPLPELCDEVLIKKLERDDKFWTDFVRKSQIAAGTPELVPENLDVIQSLCMNGSWDSDHWNYLRMQLGPGAVEDAINKLHESGDLNKLLGVYIHALNDMERAYQLFSEHSASVLELRWAEARIADFAKHQRVK